MSDMGSFGNIRIAYSGEGDGRRVRVTFADGTNVQGITQIKCNFAIRELPIAEITLLVGSFDAEMRTKTFIIHPKTGERVYVSKFIGEDGQEIVLGD